MNGRFGPSSLLCDYKNIVYLHFLAHVRPICFKITLPNITEQLLLSLRLLGRRNSTENFNCHHKHTKSSNICIDYIRNKTKMRTPFVKLLLLLLQLYALILYYFIIKYNLFSRFSCLIDSFLSHCCVLSKYSCPIEMYKICLHMVSRSFIVKAEDGKA